MSPATRLGVIGAGGRGLEIIRQCAELDVLTAVCDPKESALLTVRADYPKVRAFSDVNEMLREPLDGVLIAAPASLHTKLALAAFDADKHVFVEKPMALSVDDGMRMARASERSGRQLFVGYALLYHPAVRRLRKLISEGAVGRVWHVRSRRTSLGRLNQHESVWWTFAPQDVAVVLAIVGEEPLSATATHAGWLTPRIPDTAYAAFQFSMGCSAHLEVSWLDPLEMTRLDVFGTEGVLTFEETTGGSSLRVAACGARPDERGDMCAWRGQADGIPVDSREPLREALVAFLTSIRFGIPAETDSGSGLAVLRALAMADKAAVRGQSVEAVV